MFRPQRLLVACVLAAWVGVALGCGGTGEVTTPTEVPKKEVEKTAIVPAGKKTDKGEPVALAGAPKKDAAPKAAGEPVIPKPKAPKAGVLKSGPKAYEDLPEPWRSRLSKDRFDYMEECKREIDSARELVRELPVRPGETILGASEWVMHAEKLYAEDVKKWGLVRSNRAQDIIRNSQTMLSRAWGELRSREERLRKAKAKLSDAEAKLAAAEKNDPPYLNPLFAGCTTAEEFNVRGGIPWESLEPVRLGAVQVRITGLVIGKVKGVQFGREGESVKPALVIKLELLNVHPTKKVEYTPWGGKEVSFEDEGGRATIKDNFDNKYRIVTYGLGVSVTGAIKSMVSIHPDKTLNDVLVFEPPIDKATHLDLELPAKNYSGEGMIHIRIPMKYIVRE
jgi:hypothetical protein